MKRGFTIIELLVVMAIIAMLASIMFVVFSGLQAKSRDTRRLEDVREIEKALSLYYIDGNRYPQAVTPVTITGSDAVSTALVNAGAIAAVPADPVSPEYNYTYQATTTGSYVITYCIETDDIPNHTQGCNNTTTP